MWLRPYLPNLMELFSNIQVNIEDLPKVETLVFQPLERRYRKVLVIFRIILILVVALLLSFFFIALITEPLPGNWNTILYFGLPILFLLFVVWSFVSVVNRFKNMHYALRQKDVVYKSGWLWKQMTTIPFNRVQHVSIDQGPIERRFNLSRLKIFTAGGGASDMTIPGLDPTTADDLKEYIVKKTLAADEEQ